MARPAGSSRSLTIALIAAATSCVVLTGSCGFFAFQTLQRGLAEASPLIACQSDLESVRGALLDFAAANEGKLPTANAWKSDLKPFFEARQKAAKENISTIPEIGKQLVPKLSKVEGEWGCQINPTVFHAFMYNSDLSGKNLKDFKKPATVIAFFESKNAVNGSSTYKPTSEKTGPVFNGELREFMKIGLEGEIRDQVNVGSGSPADRNRP